MVGYWNKLPVEIKDIDKWEGIQPNWNNLPPAEKCVKSVNAFKNKLAGFKAQNFNSTGNFWELSQEIFVRINDNERTKFVEYMMDNPDVAKRKKINTRVV